MKKFLLTSLVVLVTACIFVALGITFPIYTRMLPLLFILFLMDGYLWFSVRRTILDLKPIWKYPVVIIYWLPLILLIWLYHCRSLSFLR